MANQHKGGVDFSVGDKSYTLRLTANDLCELESVTDMKAPAAVGELLATLQTASVDYRLLRALLWAGLNRNHKMTIEQCGDLIDEAGLKAVTTAIGKLIVATWPAPEEHEGTAPPNPT